MNGPRFNDAGASARKKTAEEWEAEAPRRGRGANPDGLPAKYARIRFNLWEHEKMQLLARKRGLTMQQLVRNAMREVLFSEFER